MELMQLEMFVALVEERSFQRAAERVFRTQPAVTIGVQKLEGSVGVPLLDRSQRKSGRLTPAGEILYECASRMLGLRRCIIRFDKKRRRELCSKPTRRCEESG
jgi:DNA-binding transcriptional LysR family regulator